MLSLSHCGCGQFRPWTLWTLWKLFLELHSSRDPLTLKLAQNANNLFFHLPCQQGANFQKLVLVFYNFTVNNSNIGERWVVGGVREGRPQLLLTVMVLRSILCVEVNF